MRPVLPPTSASGWRPRPEGGSESGQVPRAGRRGSLLGLACVAATPGVPVWGLGRGEGGVGGGGVCCSGLCPRAGAALRSHRGPSPGTVRRIPAPPGLAGLGTSAFRSCFCWFCWRRAHGWCCSAARWPRRVGAGVRLCVHKPLSCRKVNTGRREVLGFYGKDIDWGGFSGNDSMRALLQVSFCKRILFACFHSLGSARLTGFEAVFLAPLHPSQFS